MRPTALGRNGGKSLAGAGTARPVAPTSAEAATLNRALDGAGGGSAGEEERVSSGGSREGPAAGQRLGAPRRLGTLAVALGKGSGVAGRQGRGGGGGDGVGTQRPAVASEGAAPQGMGGCGGGRGGEEERKKRDKCGGSVRREARSGRRSRGSMAAANNGAPLAGAP
jgi:hypothetical protein